MDAFSEKTAMGAISMSSKEVLANCDICGEPVKVEVFLEEIAKQKDGILRVMIAHGEPLHAIVVYVDKNLRVRMIEYPDRFKLDQQRTADIIQAPDLAESLSETRGEPCYQALYSYDAVSERERASFILDRTILKVICESGTICLSQVRQKVAFLEKAMGDRIDLAQIQAICSRYMKEGLIKSA